MKRAGVFSSDRFHRDTTLKVSSAMMSPSVLSTCMTWKASYFLTRYTPVVGSRRGKPGSCRLSRGWSRKSGENVRPMQPIVSDGLSFWWSIGMAELTCRRRHTGLARLGSRTLNQETLLTALDRREPDLFPPWLAYNIFPVRPFSALSNHTLVGDHLSSL